MMPAAAANLPHVVVLGAGFGGLRFCQEFPSSAARITLVDRQNHHLFQPLLYQVATAGLSAPDIAQPVRGILSDKPNLQVLMAEVTGFDLDRRRVLLDRGELAFDYLVLALGSVTSYFGHDDWEAHAPGLKTLDDALRIRRKILSAFEQAETEPDPGRRAELMTTVVVGGGPTGVELAGAFAELARHVLRKDFDRIDPTTARVVLIEGGDRVLGSFHPKLSEKALVQLQKMGVEVRTGLRVQGIEPGVVHVAGESIRAGNIVWGAGVAANPLAAKLGVPLDRGGRISVAPDLTLPGHPRVFVVGDLVALVDANGVAVPGLAPAAMQMGEYAAHLISEECRPHPAMARQPFTYVDKGTMATIGRSAAVASVGRFRFSGFLAWAAWLLVHLLFLVGFRNKLLVLFQWTYSYVTYKRGARIITGVSGERSAGSA